MGSGTGPVMAGMMVGYMDIPVTCLSAMKEDQELMEARVNLLFRTAATSDGLLSQEDFINGYLGFFDNAPRVLDEIALAPSEPQAHELRVGDPGPSPDRDRPSECTLQ